MYGNSPPDRIIPKLLDGFWKQNKVTVYLFEIATRALSPVSEEISIFSTDQPGTEPQHCKNFNAISRNHF